MSSHRQNRDVTVDKGNLAGKGVYAARDFVAGEIVVSYNLTPITGEQFNALPESEKMFTHEQDGRSTSMANPSAM